MVSVFIGTRPEAVKLAPVIVELGKHGVQVAIVATGQQEVDAYLQAFGLTPDIRLGQGIDKTSPLGVRTAGIMAQTVEHLQWSKPTSVIIQGDTATVLAVAMAAFLIPIPVVHVEAGLRTHDIECPYPEEGIRQIVARTVSLHCAPTHQAAQNLACENVEGRVVMTGNTVVDGIRLCESKAVWPAGWKVGTNPAVLVTCHRRENWGQKARQLANMIRTTKLGIDFHVLMHPHPDARKYRLEMGEFECDNNVWLHEPISYLEMIGVLKKVALTITDSGGLVEEATTLGRPTIIYRDKTERMEALHSGLAVLAPNCSEVLEVMTKWIANPPSNEKSSVFGTGIASAGIVSAMAEEGML